MEHKIKKKKILVIGDVMLDTYFNGSVDRISPEAPVPVFKKYSERSVPGGAANVAVNLVAANQKVSVMSVIGNDLPGDTLISEFEQKGICSELIYRSENRKTTEKTRFLSGNNQQVLRLDVEDVRELSENESQILLKMLKENIERYDIILLSDYMKGMLTYAFTQAVIQTAKIHNIPVIIDVKDPKTEKYEKATLLKPNRKELHDLTGMPVASDDQIVAASESLRRKCDCKYVLTTCGARGMILVGDGEPYMIPSFGQEVYDVTGAGDTTIAYLAACMANRFSMRESVDMANCAAGIQVSKIGTSPVFLSEVRECLVNEKEGMVHKILNEDTIRNFRENNKDKTIVFTNGCFDILHIGHVRYLQSAAKLGDVLVVGLNSDASVKRLKGSTRPINNEKDRSELLASLGFVDYVAVFDSDTPYNLIEQIQPDILVKGSDYAPEEVVGKDIVEQRGGKLVLIPFVEGKSTTGIIEKIMQH